MSSPAPTPSGRLQRSTRERVLGGVCGGIAERMHWDATLVRVVAILLAVFSGIGVVAYLGAMLIVPEDGQAEPIARRALDGSDRMLALALSIATLIAFGAATSGSVWLFGDKPGWWIVGVVVLGALVILRGQRRGGGGGVDDRAPTTVAPVAEPAPEDRGSGGGRMALGLTLLGVAAVGVIAAASGGDFDWGVALAACVLALGAALILVAPCGGARLLIPLGLLLATTTGVAMAADLNLGDGAGERHYAPRTAADVRPHYDLTAGRIVLDLRHTEFAPGTTTIKSRMSFGELIVRMPERTKVHVTGHVSGGEVQVMDRDENGTGVDVDQRTPGRPAPGESVIALDAHLGFGRIAVVRGDAPVDDGPHHRYHYDTGAIVAFPWR